MRYGIEVCDDNNVQNGDGCTSNCLVKELGWTCTTPLYGLSACTADCNPTNAYVVGTYTCSDDNSVNGDGCD